MREVAGLAWSRRLEKLEEDEMINEEKILKQAMLGRKIIMMYGEETYKMEVDTAGTKWMHDKWKCCRVGQFKVKTIAV